MRQKNCISFLLQLYLTFTRCSQLKTNPYNKGGYKIIPNNTISTNDSELILVVKY
jgi:hypothetical protein